MRAAVLLTVVCPGLRAVVIQNIGPFEVRFYNDGETPSYGGGRSIQNWTVEQMADVAFAIEQWDAGIANTAGRAIVMDVLWQELGKTPSDKYILGGSYSPSFGDGVTSWSYGEHVWRDGVNYAGAWTGYDTRIVYDVTAGSVTWNFGAAAPLSNEIDFRSVVTHELGHSVGFVPTYYPDPYDDWGNVWGTSASPYGYAGFGGLSQWDQHLVDSSGNRPQNGGTGLPADFNELDNPVYWDGVYATAAYGGPVPIYAPITYSGGSSLSHLDQNTFARLALMTPAIYTGVQFRSPSALEWEMMRDMGWSLVPEPGSLGLLALAGGVGLLRRRRTA